MQFWFARGSEVSIREQLVTQVVLGILSDDLAPGQRLPSTRDLARRFRLHANTVSAGYRQLERDKWVEFRRGSGVYVRAYKPHRPQTSAVALDQMIAQRGRGMPMPPRRGYYGGGSPTPWMADSDPGHVLIGAGIGFAIGAAIGAAGAVHNGTPVGGGVFIGGSLFGLLGAAIGASHGAGHPFVHRRRTYPAWPEDDEEGHLRSPATERNSQATLSPSKKPTLPSESKDVEASAATSPETLSRPEQPSLGTVSSPKTQNCSWSRRVILEKDCL